MMRKSVLAMLGTALGVLVLALLLQVHTSGARATRYVQHLEQPSEEAFGVCPVCGGEAELCTHLPIIQIDTGGQKVPGAPIEGPDGRLAAYETGLNGETEIAVEYRTAAEEGVFHHLEDPATESGQAMFRIRGNSSRWFSKHSYRLRLVRENDPETEVRSPMLGMDPGTEWALYGPFLDKTLIRNYMWMNLCGEITEWAPDVRFCELVLDGEYQGLYVLMEMIGMEPGRLELTKYRQGDALMSYIVRIEPHTVPEKTLDNFAGYTYRMEPQRQLELVYPGKKYQTQQVRDYVNSDFSAVEQLLFSPEMVDPSQSWQDALDMSSFVDYYILEEFMAINDAFSASTYFYRDVRGKVKIGPVWDFNNALDNFFTSMPTEGFLLAQRSWYGQLMKDEDFVAAVIHRYRELRRGVLSEENLVRFAHETEAWLGSAVDRNDDLWGYAYDPEQVTARERRSPEKGSNQTLATVNPEDHAEAMEWMEEYMTARGRWLDAHIEDLRQYCHPSKTGAG